MADPWRALVSRASECRAIAMSAGWAPMDVLAAEIAQGVSTSWAAPESHASHSVCRNVRAAEHTWDGTHKREGLFRVLC